MIERTYKRTQLSENETQRRNTYEEECVGCVRTWLWWFRGVLYFLDERNFRNDYALLCVSALCAMGECVLHMCVCVCAHMHAFVLLFLLWIKMFEKVLSFISSLSLSFSISSFIHGEIVLSLPFRLPSPKQINGLSSALPPQPPGSPKSRKRPKPVCKPAKIRLYNFALSYWSGEFHPRKTSQNASLNCSYALQVYGLYVHCICVSPVYVLLTHFLRSILWSLYIHMCSILRHYLIFLTKDFFMHLPRLFLVLSCSLFFSHFIYLSLVSYLSLFEHYSLFLIS